MIKLCKYEKGSALITALILLLGLMLIGVSTMQNLNSNYRSTSNINNIQVSFQSAESGLAQGEEAIRNSSSKLNYCNEENTNQCIWTEGNFSTNTFLDGSAWTSAQTAIRAISLSTKAPLYLIQEETFQPSELNPEARSQGFGTYYYRITAKGYGSKAYHESPTQNEASQTIVESIFIKSY